MRAQASGPPRSLGPAYVARPGARRRRLAASRNVARPIRDPHLRRADPDLHRCSSRCRSRAPERARARRSHDALFTAVSSICVTGLATVDMATHWSPFGNALVFIGVNIGGIGVLTLASILGLVISRRLGLRAKLHRRERHATRSRIHVGPVTEGQAVRLGEVGGLLAHGRDQRPRHRGVDRDRAGARACSSAGYDALARALVQRSTTSAMAFTNTGFTPEPRRPRAVRRTTTGS